MKLTCNLRWPPRGLGLGAPFISALISGRTSTAGNFKRVVWQCGLLGLLIAAAMILIDQVLFAGVSLTRIRALGGAPVWIRIVIIAYSAMTEELIYRLSIMTLVAWVTSHTLSWLRQVPPSIPIWLGNLFAAVLFGLAHVGNLPNVPHPIARAVIVNGIAGIALGWMYWKKGFEAAVMTHFVAAAFLYLGLASLL